MEASVVRVVHRLKVQNASGLHARPASMIVKILQGYKSKVELSYRKQAVDARSIMSLLTLAIRKNSWVKLTIDGEDAEETLKALISAFETRFGE